MSNSIEHDLDDDGVDRRGFLKCMAWAGTGMLWTMNGGVMSSARLAGGGDPVRAAAAADLFFVQISDSHIGFAKDANKDVAGTLREAIDRINALPRQPAFLLHTGDITQLSKVEEFDTAQQLIASARTTTGRTFYVPGEHDVLGDDGAAYLARHGKGTRGHGWYSFDHSGIHFIGLVNVLDLKAGGLGSLGAEQLDWLARDVRHLASSTPIVVFAHIPLWSVYPAWGWGTDDATQALALLKRFGSITVLNGHIHQVLQKVEGHVMFHTAMSTAFPQPAPGSAPSPGPMKVEDARLRSVLGLASVTYVPSGHSLAVVDSSLTGAVVTGAVDAGETAARDEARSATRQGAPGEVAIDNFAFAPATLTIRAGERVTWINHDDAPHQIVSVDKRFPSSTILDTGGRYGLTLAQPGTYRYFCSVHPRMTGQVVVK